MLGKFKHYAIAAALAGLIVTGAPALADTVTYKADMNAASETPPTDSKGTGSLTATYDTVTKMLKWQGSYSDLTGPETAAHFHGPAPVGKAAGVAVPIEAAKSPFEGSSTLTDAQAADLAAGNWYVNIHTGKNPKGEIRGQVVKAN